MKSLVVLVAFFLGLAASLKLEKLPQSKETYASYAANNGMVLAKAQADYQYLDCYDRFSQQGTTYRVNDYTPDLSREGMDNRFSSCCFYGIWNLFDDYDYSERNPQVSNTNALGWARFLKMSFFSELFTADGAKAFASTCKAIPALTTWPVPSDSWVLPMGTNMIPSICTNTISIEDTNNTLMAMPPA